MDKILEINELSIKFDMVTAVDNVTAAFSAGEMTGIIGANGAGKTTLFNLITGYLLPSGGSIKLAGENIVGLNPHQLVQKGLARSFQVAQVYMDFSLLENLLISLATRDRAFLSFYHPLDIKERKDEALELLNIFDLAAETEKLVSEIAEGDRKILDVCMAFALKPKILLLDEPTSGVSTDEKFQVMETLVGGLSKTNVTTILIEHDMEIIERFASRVLAMDQGKLIADGPTSEVINVISSKNVE